MLGSALGTFAWHGEVPAYLRKAQKMKLTCWSILGVPKSLQLWDISWHIHVGHATKPWYPLKNEAWRSFLLLQLWGSEHLSPNLKKKSRQHQTTSDNPKSSKKTLDIHPVHFFGVNSLSSQLRHNSPPCSSLCSGVAWWVRCAFAKMPGFSHHFSIQMAIFFEVQSFMFGPKKTKTHQNVGENRSNILISPFFSHLSSQFFRVSIVSIPISRISPFKHPPRSSDPPCRWSKASERWPWTFVRDLRRAGTGW